MKLCHIVPSLEARYGGPSKSVLGLASALSKRGDDVELLATDPQTAWERDDGRLKIRSYRRDWPQLFCSSTGMRLRLGSIEADIVHHHSIWLRTLHYANRAARRLSTPLVVSPRGMMDPWAWQHNSRRKAFARALVHPGAFEAVDGWHATSEAEAGSIADLGFRQPVCVAPNGVLVPTPDELSSARQHWTGILPSAGTRPVALFYSRLHQKKRLLETIDLWLDVAPKEWLLLIVGIPEDYTPLMIESYVQRVGQSGRVRCFDGADHPAPYAVASLFILASHGENFGLAIAEALASGVPALVTNTTPWLGLNRNGAGWCLPWKEFGSAIQSATAETAEKLSQRGSIGRAWVEREYSWLKAAEILSTFYSSFKSETKLISL